MKIVLTALIALALAQGACAQTKFSFSELQWGEGIETVNSKLKVAGFSGCAIVERLACRALGKCQCTFSGPGVLESRAEFEESGLDRVRVMVADADSVYEVLKRKYGPTLPKRDLGGTPGSFMSIDLSNLWQSGSGETIELSGASVTYTSAAFYRRQDTRKRSETSKF